MKMIAMMMITITLITLAGSLPVKTKTNKILSVMNDDEENINEDYNDYNDIGNYETDDDDGDDDHEQDDGGCNDDYNDDHLARCLAGKTKTRNIRFVMNADEYDD